MQVWNRIKWIFKTFIQLKKKSYPLVNYGVRILYLAVASPIFGLAITIFLTPTDPIPFLDQLGITVSTIADTSKWMSVVSLVVGIGLIIIGVYTTHKQARKTAKVLIVSMLGKSAHFPDEILFESEKLDSRETIELGLQEENNYIEKSIEMFNAEKMVDIYHRFILHHDCKKVYLGGRARVPFLLAYGSCFRSITAKTIYFDQFHLDGKWSLLDDENENISLIYDDVNNVQPNEDGDIGLAVGFTTKIVKHQLPDYIKDHTLSISPSIKEDRNLIKSQENLEQIAHEIKDIIDQLSRKEHCRAIHLFLSIQTPLALELGRNYQEGTHKKWVIHNFVAAQGKYIWAIQLSSDGIEKFIKT